MYTVQETQGIGKESAVPVLPGLFEGVPHHTQGESMPSASTPYNLYEVTVLLERIESRLKRIEKKLNNQKEKRCHKTQTC